MYIRFLDLHVNYLKSSSYFFFPLPTDAQLLTIKTKQENDFLNKHLTDDPLITSRVWLDVKLDSAGKAWYLD